MGSVVSGYSVGMRKIRRLVVLGAGAAAAYFLDPSEGKIRRSRLVSFVKSKRNHVAQESFVDPGVQSTPDITVVIVTEADDEIVEPQVVDLG